MCTAPLLGVKWASLISASAFLIEKRIHDNLGTLCYNIDVCFQALQITGHVQWYPVPKIDEFWKRSWTIEYICVKEVCCIEVDRG